MKAMVLGNCRSERRSREEFCLVYSLAWGLGVSMRTFSGLMTLFASTQVGMSGLVYKLQQLTAAQPSISCLGQSGLFGFKPGSPHPSLRNEEGRRKRKMLPVLNIIP